MRESLRRAAFDFFARAFSTDNGRRILADALADQLSAPAMSALESAAITESPYADLGTVPSPVDRFDAPPVFITARFRSGSTLLWNMFRQLPGCRAYYEPLNERQWFDPARRGERVDRTHLGVSDYWREYEGLAHLKRYYRDRWADRQLYMSDRSWDPNLKAYIEALIEAAAPQQPVLQFNRVDFRLQWLRRHFPDARIIHLYRHPRDQWCSSLVDLRSCGTNCTVAEFAARDHFYLLSWARDLRYQFPFLDPATAEHPYDLFYWIWKLSYVFGRRFADDSFAFEALVRSPDREIMRIVAAAGANAESIQPLKAVIAGDGSIGRWTAYADEEWFRRRESHCETVLADFVRPRAARATARSLTRI
jgi:sulfotransferase family protein